MIWEFIEGYYSLLVFFFLEGIEAKFCFFGAQFYLQLLFYATESPFTHQSHATLLLHV